MVSGLVTSPCDHCRIFSGDASEIRIASKSGASCVFSCWNLNTLISPLIKRKPFTGFTGFRPDLHVNPEQSRNPVQPSLRFHGAGHDRFTNTILRAVTVTRSLLVDQLNIETQRLQLAHEHVERLRQTWIEIRLAL